MLAIVSRGRQARVQPRNVDVDSVYYNIREQVCSKHDQLYQHKHDRPTFYATSSPYNL